MQKAIAVKPTFGGDTSLDVAELRTWLDQGWEVADMAESTNGAILVILNPPQAAAQPA